MPKESGIEQARAKLGEIVNRAEYSREITYLTRNGRRVAAVVPLDAIEDAADGDQDQAAEAAAELAGQGGPLQR